VRLVKAEHQGVAPTLKAAIAQTRGAYIGWVDSDDLLAADALAQTAAVLEAAAQVGLVYSDYRVIDAQGQDRGLGSRCRIPYSPERLLVEFMTFHFRLLRRSLYEQVGGIDPSFERAEDYDLCLRLSEVTEIAHLPQPLYCYRQHSESLTGNHLEMTRWAFLASTAALQRRGMAQTHCLELTCDQQFRLFRREV
jgi:cellulose synthase/poly-beta-1,6-N-acetylglucosamine synthase-like glycosyltransferase